MRRLSQMENGPWTQAKEEDGEMEQCERQRSSAKIELAADRKALWSFPQ